MGDGYLLPQLGDRFTLLTFGADAPDTQQVDGITLDRLALDVTPELAERYLGDATSAVYLIRPDQHVAARWPAYDQAAVKAALTRAIGKE